MNIEVIKTSKNTYKLVTKSNRKDDPLLMHLADMCKTYNKYSDIKVGIYSITGGDFSIFKRVYSFISKRVELMKRKDYYKFIRGKKQLKAKKNPMDDWKALDPQKESEFVLDLD